MAEWEQGRATIGGNILHHHLTKPFPLTSVHMSHRTEETLTVSRESTSQVPGRGARSQRKERADLPMNPALNELFP